MEDAFEKFFIFGGVSWDKMPLEKPAMELVERYMLSDFGFIRNDINLLTTGLPLHHAILSGIAQGDGKMHTAFKRAGVSSEVGSRAIEELRDSGIIQMQKTKRYDANWKTRPSPANRLFFASPFLHFWFAFVSPIFKGVRDGDYSEIRSLFANRAAIYMEHSFAELSRELMKSHFAEDAIVEMQSYSDEDVELDIYAKSASGKIIVGLSKYTNSKLKKSELTKLQEQCRAAEIEADIFVLVSKSGFSSELKALKSQELKLFMPKHFKQLLEE